MTALPSSGSFAMVDPTHVAAVGPAAAILFARIVWRSRETGEWRATRRVLLQETGLTEPMLRTAQAVLRDREWVAARRTSTEDATLIWTPIHAGQGESAESAPPLAESAPPLAESATPPSGIRNAPPAESAMSSYETSKITTPLPPEGEQDALFAPAAAPEAPEVPADPLRGFDAWYTAYPRKVAKGDARKAWTQVLRAGADPEAILTGLHSQIETLRDQHARGFCPYPASWLRAERWEDAPDNVRQFPAVPSPVETYDPAYAASLPPAPRRDLFG